MSDTFKFVQAQSFTLAGAGATIGDTSLTLTSFQLEGTNLAMTDFGSKGWGTLEPGNGDNEEQIYFTGVTQNSNGTATLTGVYSVLMKAPYTATSGVTKSHAGGVKFVISNTAGFYDSLSGKNNDETISGLWTFTTLPQSSVTPSNALDLSTKAYVDNRHGYWEAPVATYTALPTGVNVGEVRVVLDTMLIYMWSGAAWTVFTATPVVQTVDYFNGKQSTGGDHRTFTSSTTWTSATSVSVFLDGARMSLGASADYTIASNTIIFNYDVVDADIITLVVTQ